MSKTCELCRRTARIFCDSDQASLCYDCDQSIHSANFLVAKHSRTLLCHKCQSLTPWIASGRSLGRAASLCVICLDENLSRRRMLDDETSHHGNNVAEENLIVRNRLGEGGGETDDDDVECSDSEEDEENQVVPWSSVESASSTASSSTSERFSSSRFSSDCFNSDLKRKRMDGGFDSEDDTECSSERSMGKARTETDNATSLIYFSNIKGEQVRQLRM